MKFHALMLVTLLAGCGDDGGIAAVDAPPRADAPPSCPSQTGTLAAGSHKVFVAFEGVTLTLGDCDDAKTNCSSLVAQASTQVPAFLAAESTRASHVSTIAGMVQDALAPFSVHVVTTRPASGDYWMVVVGGTSDTVTGVSGTLVAAKPVCDATNTSSIAFAFEQDSESPPTTSDRAYANTIAGAFGSLAGLVPSTRSGDCMCLTTTCPQTQLCTFGTLAATKPGNACMRDTQNEQLLLMDAVGCR